MTSNSNRRPGNNPVDSLAAWEVTGEETIYETKPWIRLSRQVVRLPNGRIVDDYHQIHLTDFAVVCAQTADGRILVERQYKHGIGKVSLTLPAGMVEAGEDPLEGAKRELLEETGYVADEWQNLGTYVVNSNYGCGHAHLFSARNARHVAEAESGDLKEMAVELMTTAEIVAAAREGQIGAISSIAALALATHPLWNGMSDKTPIDR